jgi:hypothetical protein
LATAAAGLALLALAIRAAAAQEPQIAANMATEATPLSQLFAKNAAPPAEKFIVDSAVQPASYAGDNYDSGPAPVAGAQPVNWISGPYLKLGVATAIGGDVINSHDAGWTVAGGYRVPFGPAFDERLFSEFGGSYQSVYGSTTHLAPGVVITTVGQSVTRTTEANLFSAELREVKRATVDAAIGWYWGDPIDVRSGDPQYRFATRLGGRWGHVRGRFLDTATRQHLANETFAVGYGRTTTIGGLFIGNEAILLARDTRVGSVAVSLDGVIGNDWIDFRAWGRGSLGTASITLGFMLSR